MKSFLLSTLAAAASFDAVSAWSKEEYSSGIVHESLMAKKLVCSHTQSFPALPCNIGQSLFVRLLTV